MRAATLPVLAALVAAVPVAAQSTAQPFQIPTTNPPAVVQQRVAATDIEIRYHRPRVKGREIFGGLVPWGRVWRTGSDNATRISFGTAVTLNGARVEAGTYELFTIPGEREWTVILQANQTQWGSYSYDPAHDVVRIPARPVRSADAVESFTLGVDDVTSKSATLNIAWDHTRVPVSVEIDIRETAVPLVEAALQADGQKPYFLAAMFYFENGLDMGRAAELIGLAVEQAPTHIGILHRQALILEAKGDTVGAIAAAEKSLAGAATSPRELREEYTRLNTAVLERLRGR